MAAKRSLITHASEDDMIAALVQSKRISTDRSISIAIITSVGPPIRAPMPST